MQLQSSPSELKNDFGEPSRCSAEIAERRLRGDSHVALRNLSYTSRGAGEVTLRGYVPTYYLKQLAQAIVATIEGVTQINNQIEVNAGSRPNARA